MSNASRELAPAIMVQCDAWRLPRDAWRLPRDAWRLPRAAWRLHRAAWRLPRDAWRLPRGRPYRQPQLLGIAPTSLEYHKKAAQKGGLTCFFIGGLRKTVCL